MNWKIEIRIEYVKDWFRRIGLPVDKSKIYLVQEIRPEHIHLPGPYGIFYPRTLTGYIAINRFLNNIIKTYIHEIAHGAYFENTPSGKNITQLDKEVYELEKKIFGQENPKNVIVSIYDGRTIIFNEKVVFANNHEFEEYVCKSRLLNLLCNIYLPYIEAFSRISVEEFFGMKETFNGSFNKAYILLKEIRNKNGIEGVVKYLYEI